MSRNTAYLVSLTPSVLKGSREAHVSILQQCSTISAHSLLLSTKNSQCYGQPSWSARRLPTPQEQTKIMGCTVCLARCCKLLNPCRVHLHQEGQPEQMLTDEAALARALHLSLMEVQQQEHAHVPGSGAQPAAAASTALRDTVPEDMQAMAPEYTPLSPGQHLMAMPLFQGCALGTAVCSRYCL